MQTRTLLFLSLLLSIGADASEGGAQSENYCHDDAMWAPMEALLKAHPDDTLVIRGYAMRLGLCRLIDDGKISLETGIKLYRVGTAARHHGKGPGGGQPETPKGAPGRGPRAAGLRRFHGNSQCCEHCSSFLAPVTGKSAFRSATLSHRYPTSPALSALCSALHKEEHF